LNLNGSGGTLQLGGEPGFTTGHLSAAQDILGKPVTMSLYTTVAGQGNNTVFTIVGFVGVRVVDVQVNGNNKGITVQPAIVSDATAITGTNSNSSFVYGPVKVVN